MARSRAADGADGAGPLRRGGDRRALGALPARRPRPCRVRRRDVPHRPVAGDAGRLGRQAGGGRRHVVERRAGRPRHRRRGGVAHRVPAHAQLVHAPQQPAHHARGTGRAAGRVRSSCARSSTPRCTASTTRPTTAAPSRTRRRGAPAVLREDVEQPGLHQADEQLPRPPLQPRGQRRVVRVHRRQDPRASSTTRRRPTG